MYSITKKMQQKDKKIKFLNQKLNIINLLYNILFEIHSVHLLQVLTRIHKVIIFLNFLFLKIKQRIINIKVLKHKEQSFLISWFTPKLKEDKE